MATIHDLDIPDLTKLSDDELINLIIETRKRRRNPSAEVKKKNEEFKEKRKKRGTNVTLKGLDVDLEGLSAEEASELLKNLRGE